MQASTSRTDYIAWLKSARTLSVHTIRAYDSDLRQFETAIGSVDTSIALTRDNVLAFVACQREAQLAESSIRRRVATLTGYATWLSNNGQLTAGPHPTRDIEVRPVRRLPRALADADLRRLLAHLRRATARAEGCPSRQEADRSTLLVVSLMIATGIRVGEAVTIRTSDVDLCRGSIRILGKGSRERTVYLGSPMLASDLAAHLRRRADTDGDARLFRLDDGRPLQPDLIRRRVVSAAVAAGVIPRVTPHVLRHSAATQLVASGVDIRYVQRLLGHSSIGTTERYTLVTDVALAEAISGARVLDTLVGGADN